MSEKAHEPRDPESLAEDGRAARDDRPDGDRDYSNMHEQELHGEARTFYRDLGLRLLGTEALTGHRQGFVAGGVFGGFHIEDERKLVEIARRMGIYGDPMLGLASGERLTITVANEEASAYVILPVALAWLLGEDAS